MNRGWIPSVPNFGFVRWSTIYTVPRLIPQSRQRRFDKSGGLGRFLNRDFVTTVGAGQSRPFNPGYHLLVLELGGEHGVQSGRKRCPEGFREIVTAAHPERLSFR
jgi:hypothetical protein